MQRCKGTRAPRSSDDIDTLSHGYTSVSQRPKHSYCAFLHCPDSADAQCPTTARTLRQQPVYPLLLTLGLVSPVFNYSASVASGHIVQLTGGTQMTYTPALPNAQGQRL